MPSQLQAFIGDNNHFPIIRPVRYTIEKQNEWKQHRLFVN